MFTHKTFLFIQLYCVLHISINNTMHLKPNHFLRNTLLSILQKITDQKKYVIGTQERSGMGSSLHALLNHLYYCEKKGLTPVVFWNEKSLYYKKEGFNNKSNVWEYYFEPLSPTKYQLGDKINYNSPHNSHIYFVYQNAAHSIRKDAARLMKKYNIRPNKHVQTKIDTFYKKNIEGNHTIAIHIRGTDKIKEEKPVNPKSLIKEALKHAHEKTQFYIATDEQTIMDQALSLLKGRKVIYWDCFRSLDGSPLHIGQKEHPQASRAQVGEDIVIEMYLLSKCDFLVRTLSNVSNFVLYLNPAMPYITLR